MKMTRSQKNLSYSSVQNLNGIGSPHSSGSSCTLKQGAKEAVHIGKVLGLAVIGLKVPVLLWQELQGP